MNKPEQYGAKPNDETVNSAYAINKCIMEHSVCELEEGTYYIGGEGISESDPEKVLKSGILWGWNPKQNEDGVRIIGTGKGKTILKLSKHLSGRIDLAVNGNQLIMVQAVGPGGDGRIDCKNIVFKGITFDGNYDEINEVKGSELTTAGCTTFGSNTLYEDCEFKGFNVGKDNATSFVIISLLSKNSKDGAKGTTVRRCDFHSPGRNNRYPEYDTEQIVHVQVGGHLAGKVFATECLVEHCTFRGDAGKTQFSPLAGISVANTKGATIRKNNFDGFQGMCYYVDTGMNIGTVVEENSALEVPCFVRLSAQNYVRQYGSEWWTVNYAYHHDLIVKNNNVKTTGKGTWNWKPGKYAPWDGIFLGYSLDRDLNLSTPAFKNIVIQDNTINVDPDNLLKNLGGWWPPINSYGNAVPNGPVPNEPVIGEIKLINNHNQFVISSKPKSMSLIDKIKKLLKCK
jgi:hypothetical protein